MGDAVDDAQAGEQPTDDASADDATETPKASTGRVIGAWWWMLEFFMFFLIVMGYQLIGWAFYSQVEGWTFLECMYFGTVTQTTIGYGDIVPGTKTGKWFTIFYSMVGVGLILKAYRKMGWLLVKLQTALVKEATLKLLRALHSKEKRKNKTSARKPAQNLPAWKRCWLGLAWCIDHFFCKRLTMFYFFWFDTHYDPYIPLPLLKLKWLVRIVFPLVVYLCIGAAMGVIEGWNFTDSVYFSAITITTVGYGDVHPKTPAGQIFCIFYVPFAIVTLLFTGNKIVQWMHQNFGNKQFKDVLMKNHVDSLKLRNRFYHEQGFTKTTDSGEISEADFICAALRATQKCDRHTLELIRSCFTFIDEKSTSGRTGFLREEDMKLMDGIKITCADDLTHFADRLKENGDVKRNRQLAKNKLTQKTVV